MIFLLKTLMSSTVKTLFNLPIIKNNYKNILFNIFFDICSVIS